MIQIKTFSFNPLALNTYVAWDEQLTGFIVDAGNHNNEEDRLLFDFVASQGIKIEALLLTHLHIDHIMGVQSVCRQYDLKPYFHEAGAFLLENAAGHATAFGMTWRGFPDAVNMARQEEDFKIGNISISTLYTPGHVDGSLCFHLPGEDILFAGDVLFRQGIGRTDLPTGDFQTLTSHIKNRLFRLPANTTVYPGHGPHTTIGYEKTNNPFF